MLKIPTNDNYKTLKITILISLLIFATIMSWLATKQYETIQLEKKTAEQIKLVEKQTNERILKDKEAKLNSDIDRLVSICHDSLERYNKLSTSDKAKTYAPNCELSTR